MLENKMAQLTTCVKQIIGESNIEIVSYTCNDLNYKTPNFTTAGIFHLQGIASMNHEQLPWSIIIKIIKSDSEEKDNPHHHNYWRREALVFQSKILEELPGYIKTPKCYLVEEHEDGMVWLWMERIEGEYASTKQQFDFIAEQIGRFNGAYLMGEKIPEEKWICKGWLTSWITSSRRYAPNPEDYIDHLNNEQERSVWTWFESFTTQTDRLLNTLSHLPGVLAHQDLSQMNMLLGKNHVEEGRLALIDWQFMSISGIGEDLGKMFGVNMSLGIIPAHLFEEYKESLFNANITGLKSTGWQGDERQARYGYCLSTSLRSVWEVPQYIKWSAQLATDPSNTRLQEQVTQLEQVIKIHQKMAHEAEMLINEDLACLLG